MAAKGSLDRLFHSQGLCLLSTALAPIYCQMHRLSSSFTLNSRDDIFWNCTRQHWMHILESVLLLDFKQRSMSCHNDCTSSGCILPLRLVSIKRLPTGLEDPTSCKDTSLEKYSPLYGSKGTPNLIGTNDAWDAVTDHESQTELCFQICVPSNGAQFQAPGLCHCCSEEKRMQ